MTITTNDTRDEYTATNGQTVFNYTFKIFADTDLKVYQTLNGNDPDDAADLITAYTVAGVGSESGGTITLTSSAAAGDKITIVSDVPDSRTTDYQVNGDFVPDTVNDDFDRVVTLVKQVLSAQERIPQFQNSLQSQTGATLDDPVASQFLRWKADLSGIESVSLNTTGAVTEADAVSIADAGGYYTGTNVEDALQEVGADIATLQQADTFYWSRFEDVTELTLANTTPALCQLTPSRFALADGGTNLLIAYDIASDGTISQVGSTFAITLGGCDICRLSDSTIALADDTSGVLETYTFNGSTWSKVGNTLSLATISDPQLDALSSTRIVMAEVGDDTITAYDWDGTDWTQEGNQFNYVSQVSLIGVCALSSTRIITIGSSSNTLIEYNFDGTDWNQATGSLNIGGGIHKLTALGGNFFAHFDNSNDELQIWKKPDSTTVFSQESPVLSITNGTGAMTGISGTDIIYASPSDGKIYIYRSNVSTISPHSLNV